ncbi:hypothetical protein [Plantactinospora sp. GCM10030261]|uniref:hypothetical protein n=1 Tax=Plantactinospora sp. GCM10030261 TaxID=3273420 RepID=UPI003618C8BB
MTTDDNLPGPLRWAIRLLRIEAVGVGAVAAYLLYADLTATAVDLTSALIVTAFAVAGAVVLWLLGTALARRRPAARAPVIVLQFMLFPVGYFMTMAGLAWLGLPLIVLGATVCFLLVSPATTRALGVR